MPKYLYEFQDAAGKRGQGFIAADSSGQAAKALAALAEGAGWHSSRLLDDDLLAALREQRNDPPLDEAVLARLEVISHQGGGRLALLREGLVRNRWLLLFFAGLLIVGLVQEYGLVLYMGLAGLAAIPIVLFGLGAPADHYRQLLIASATGDAKSMFALADKLDRVARHQPQMAFDLDMRRAAAHARLGQLDKALALAGPWQSRGVEPQGIYWDRLALVYAAADQPGEFIACMARAFEESGQAVWARVDYALALALSGDDPAAALVLLHSGEVDDQPDSTLRFVHWVRGTALLRLGDAPGAEAVLARAVEGFLDQSDQPAVWPSLAVATGALAVAGSLNGRPAQARQAMAPVRKIFDVHAPAMLKDMVLKHVDGQ